jgi:hypothetical protein
MVSQVHPLYVVLATLLLAIVSIAPAPAGTVPPEHTPDPDTVQQQLESLRPVFRRNLGQWSNEVLYRTNIQGNSVRFMPGGVSFAYIEHDEEKEGEGVLATDATEEEHEEALIWNVMFDGMSRDAHLVGENEQPGPVSYFIGNDPANHHANVPECSRLWYRDIYPKIDLRYSDADGALKYDYIIRPGGMPSSIAMRCDGIEGLRINERGELEITTAWGVIVEGVPVAWQDIDGKRQSVDVRYKLLNDTAYGFALHGAYQPDHELVIDPVIFGWATFVGGNDASADGYLLDIALDIDGNVYGSGHYTVDFPTTPGVFQRDRVGAADIFVFKLNRYGSQLLYATYIGGSGNDSATGIVITPRGEAIICGTTHSGDYPRTARSLSNMLKGGSDLVLTKLNATGNAVLFSTLVGGTRTESRAHMAVDSSGDIYLAGATSSGDFPTTANAYDKTLSGSSDAVIVKFSPNADTLRYATFLGGSQSDTAATIAVDYQGNAVVAGTTTSQDFPVTPGTFDGAGIANGQGGWLAKITPDGRNLIAST